MYGAATEHEPLSWPWVEDRLSEPGTMWVTATSEGFPHPRPVWGVWYRDRLHLSIGTPSINAAGSVASFGVAARLGYGDQISNRVVDALGDLAGGIRLHDPTTPQD
jgi:hypothetical protein